MTTPHSGAKSGEGAGRAEADRQSSDKVARFRLQLNEEEYKLVASRRAEKAAEAEQLDAPGLRTRPV